MLTVFGRLHKQELEQGILPISIEAKLCGGIPKLITTLSIILILCKSERSYQL